MMFRCTHANINCAQIFNFAFINLNEIDMSANSTLKNPTSVSKKIALSLVVALALSALVLVIGNGGNIPWFPPQVVFSVIALSILSSAIFPFLWHWLEKNNQIDSVQVYSILYTILRYLISLNLLSFGWKKIFGLQFLVPEAIASQPLNSVAGEWLTWYYFGFSKSFGLIIAAIQIIGSCFLLYKRTLMLGLFILFALMSNLLLINIFYDMNAGALVQSAIIMTAITYLLLEQYSKIKAFFLTSICSLPTMDDVNIRYKNSARFFVIIFSIAFTVYLKTLLKHQ